MSHAAEKPLAVVGPHPLQRASILLSTYVAILILGDLILPRPPMCGGSAPSPQSKVTVDLVTIQSAAESYALDHGNRWPPSIEELARGDAGGGPYLNRVPLDPWHHPYHYEPSNGQHGRPRVCTLGKDMQPGGEGADADVDDTMSWNGESWDRVDWPR